MNTVRDNGRGPGDFTRDQGPAMAGVYQKSACPLGITVVIPRDATGTAHDYASTRKSRTRDSARHSQYSHRCTHGDSRRESLGPHVKSDGHWPRAGKTRKRRAGSSAAAAAGERKAADDAPATGAGETLREKSDTMDGGHGAHGVRAARVARRTVSTQNVQDAAENGRRRLVGNRDGDGARVETAVGGGRTGRPRLYAGHALAPSSCLASNAATVMFAVCGSGTRDACPTLPVLPFCSRMPRPGRTVSTRHGTCRRAHAIVSSTAPVTSVCTHLARGNAAPVARTQCPTDAVVPKLRGASFSHSAASTL